MQMRKTYDPALGRVQLCRGCNGVGSQSGEKNGCFELHIAICISRTLHCSVVKKEWERKSRLAAIESMTEKGPKKGSLESTN